MIQEGGVANVGAPIAYVAESDADLQEAKSKLGGASNGNGAAPAAKEVPKEEVAKVEAPVAAKSEAASAPPPPPPAPAAAQPAAPQKRADGRIIATPYAKKLAKELGVDLNSLAGSGPAGRITASDVEGFKKGGNGAATAPPPSAPSTPSPAPAPSAQTPPADMAPSTPQPVSTSVSELKGTTQPFNALQAAVAKNMVESLKVSTAGQLPFIPLIMCLALCTTCLVDKLPVQMVHKASDPDICHCSLQVMALQPYCSQPLVMIAGA